MHRGRGRGAYGGGGGFGRGGGGGYGRGRGGGGGFGGGRYGGGGAGAAGAGATAVVDNMGRTTYVGGGRGGGAGAGAAGGAGGSRFGGGSGLGSARSNREEEDAFDRSMGFARLEGGGERIGYLCNMLPTTLTGEDKHDVSCLDLYFLQQDGETFKASIAHQPYFYVAVALHAAHRTREVITTLERRYEGLIASITAVEKEDLEMLNHLSGRRREYLQLRFRNTSEASAVKSQLKPIIDRNAAAARSRDAFGGLGGGSEVRLASCACGAQLLIIVCCGAVPSAAAAGGS